MRVWKPALTALSLITLPLVFLPQAGFPEEGTEPNSAVPIVQAASTGVKDESGSESLAIEHTLRKALERSEADKADLENRYKEVSARESKGREELSRLAAEKEAIEKACLKPVDQEAKPKQKVKARKKNSSRKWWISGSATKDKAAYSEAASRKGPKSKKFVKSAGKKVNTTKKGAAKQKKACRGAVVSMAEIKRALNGKRNLAGKNLTGMNLAGMSLVGVNLSGACLARTNLERADLAEANLERAEMAGANLNSASLRLANLNAAKLEGASLENAVWTDSRICLPGSIGSCRDIIP